MSVYDPAQWAVKIRTDLDRLSRVISSGDLVADAKIADMLTLPISNAKVLKIEIEEIISKYKYHCDLKSLDSRQQLPNLAMAMSYAYSHLAEIAQKNGRLNEAWNSIVFSLSWKEKTVRARAARGMVAIRAADMVEAHAFAIKVSSELLDWTKSSHGTMMAHASHAEDDELKAYLRAWFHENHTKYRLDDAIKAAIKLIPSKPDTIRVWIIQFRKELGLSKPRKKKPRI